MDAGHVTNHTITHHTVTLDTSIEETWRLVSDPDELATWLGADISMDTDEAAPGDHAHITDDDGTRRTIVFDEVSPDDRISWHWFPSAPSGGSGPGGDAETGWLSHVDVTLRPVDGGTRVTVVERLVTYPSQVRATAQASAMAASWSNRLLELELRALTAQMAGSWRV
jgi:uncharacterized protein YndB with AHSA1/START domain